MLTIDVTDMSILSITADDLLAKSCFSTVYVTESWLELLVHSICNYPIFEHCLDPVFCFLFMIDLWKETSRVFFIVRKVMFEVPHCFLTFFFNSVSSLFVVFLEGDAFFQLLAWLSFQRQVLDLVRSSISLVTHGTRLLAFDFLVVFGVHFKGSL